MGEEGRTGKVRRTNPDIVIENDRRERDEDGSPIEKRPLIKVDPGEHRKLNTILIVIMAIILIVAVVLLFGANQSTDEYNKTLEKRIEMLEKRPVDVQKPAEVQEPVDVQTP